MQLILYREWPELPLGHHPTLKVHNVRSDGYFENFEETAKHHSINIKFSDNIDECDLVVFNLDYIVHYTNINPAFMVNTQVWDRCKELNIPIIFWHAGECHHKPSIMLDAAERYAGQRIWYVDANAYITDDRHLFFDNTDLFRAVKLYKRLYPLQIADTHEFDIGTSSLRTDIHKRIVYNVLKNYPGPKDLHYSEPNHRGNEPEFDSKYDSKYDRNTLPPSSGWISDEHLLSKKLKTSVLIQVNTYITSPLSCPQPQMYITEKFLADFLLNKPIIPLGEAGLVKYLREQGWEFPTWIDYSYDNYKDVNDRLDYFFKSVMDLSNISDLEEKSIEWQKTSSNSQKAFEYTSKQNFIDIINWVIAENGK